MTGGQRGALGAARRLYAETFPNRELPSHQRIVDDATMEVCAAIGIAEGTLAECGGFYRSVDKGARGDSRRSLAAAR